MARRPQRVGELVLRELGQIFQRGAVKDPDIGFITFTGVEMTPDLKGARVFYSTLGGAEEQARTHEALGRAKKFIRRELGQRLHLKAVPEIEFKYDDTFVRAARVESLLRELELEEKSGSAGQPESDGE